MKKSKLKSKRRDRSRSRSNDSKSKRQRPRSKSPSEKEQTKTKTALRKTRWQADDESEKNVPKKDQPLEAVPSKEKSGPPPRIKDFLHDKEKIVDILFETVTGAVLQELIPDYLKKRSGDELKKLCLEQIKNLSDDMILQIISGELESSKKDEEKKIEKEENLKLEQPSPPKESLDDKNSSVVEKKLDETADDKKKLLDTLSELQKTDTKETEKVQDEENQIPLIIKDEVAKDLIQPERDAELLELEMRARAIRSLLKAKSQAANEDETTPKDD